MSGRSWLIATVIAACAGTSIVVANEPGKAKGSITVDGTTTALSHAIRTTRPNVFNDFFSDTLVVLSNVPLTPEEAASDAALFARAQRDGLVTVAIRFDGRPKRGQLFHIAINHRGLHETALLPDVWFKHTFKAGAGTLQMAPREFSGRTYAVDVEFAVVMPVETTAADAPSGSLPLPPPSKTAADRTKATALLIEALQEGDEARSLEIVKLGVDPNGRDQKMGIALINWAVLMCQPPVVAALVELKADLTHERLPGMTLLSEARAACPDAVAYLKAGGAK